MRIAHLPRRTPIKVNIQDLSYVDDAGKELLLRMEREGAFLIGASQFLHYLLRGDLMSHKGPHIQKQEKENPHGSPVRS